MKTRITGRTSKTVHAGIDYILKQQDEKTGYIGTSMYNHGFSTLALAEAYGQVHDEPDRAGAAKSRGPDS